MASSLRTLTRSNSDIKLAFAFMAEHEHDSVRQRGEEGFLPRRNKNGAWGMPAPIDREELTENELGTQIAESVMVIDSILEITPVTEKDDRYSKMACLALVTDDLDEDDSSYRAIAPRVAPIVQKKGDDLSFTATDDDIAFFRSPAGTDEGFDEAMDFPEEDDDMSFRDGYGSFRDMYYDDDELIRRPPGNPNVLHGITVNGQMLSRRELDEMFNTNEDEVTIHLDDLESEDFGASRIGSRRAAAMQKRDTRDEKFTGRFWMFITRTDELGEFLDLIDAAWRTEKKVRGWKDTTNVGRQFLRHSHRLPTIPLYTFGDLVRALNARV